MRRAVRGLSALVLILALAIGAPIALLAVGRFDAFATIDWRHVLTTPDTGALLLGLLTLVGWLAWVLFVLTLVAEGLRVASSGRVDWRVPGTRWAQPVAAALVLAVASLVAPVGAAAQPTTSPTPSPLATSMVPEQSASLVEPTVAEATSTPSAPPAGAGQTSATDVDPPGPVHRVVPGDDLWSIAESHYGDGTKWRTIARANGLDPDAVLLPDTLLRLPGARGGQTPTHQTGAVGAGVLVREGDTLSSLAAEHLGDAQRWPELARANDDLVRDPDRIESGWVLNLPSATPEPDASPQAMPKSTVPDPGDRSTAPAPDRVDEEQAPAPIDEVPLSSPHPTSQPSPGPSARPGGDTEPLEAGVLVQHAEDGDRLEVLGSITGLLAVALASALAARRRGQLAARPLGRRIAAPELEAQRFEAALRRRASTQSEPDELWPASTIVIGLDDADDAVLLDLEPVRSTVISSSAEDPQTREEECRAALAAALTSLVSASWSAEVGVVLAGGELAWVADLGSPQLTLCDCVEAAVVQLERECAARRVELSRANLNGLRAERDTADAWQPRIYLFAEAPDADQWRRIDTALRRTDSAPDGVGVSVLAVACPPHLPSHPDLPGEVGEVIELRHHRGRLRSSGAAFAPQLIAQPARRALMDLFEATGTEQTVPAPWWSPDGDLPPTLSVLEPPSDRSCEEDFVTADHPHPTLLLLGPVTLVGAKGIEPTRARMQCAEYCAWIHENPGRTATAMNRELLVADSTRRSNLSRLRAWLGSDDEGQPYLPDAYSGRIALHPAISTDWERAQLLLAGGVNRASQDALVDVLRLVRGAPLADAAPGNWGWAEAMRVDMVSTLRDVGVVLTQRALQSGDIDLARWATSRALKAAPEDELLLCERIRTEHLAGNRSEVERLVLHVTRSARILGVDLADETVTLLQEVMEGRRRAQYA